MVAPSEHFEAVTPSDTVNLSRPSRSLYVGVAGDVVAVNANGDVVTFTNVQGGQVLPIICVRVNATNTTATDIVSLA